MKKRVLFLLFVLFSPFLSASQCISVVGLHGFMKERYSLLPIAWKLLPRGFEVYLWNYPTREYTIECHASHLVDYLCCVASRKPGQPIYFYTHSFGALILRAALNMPGCPPEARCGKIVLVAPTNTGSTLARRFSTNPAARLILGKAGRQLMDYDLGMIERCFGVFPPTVEVLVMSGSRGNNYWFTTPNDGWVSIDETALTTPYQWVNLRYTHSQLLEAPLSINYIVNFFCSPRQICTAPEASDEALAEVTTN